MDRAVFTTELDPAVAVDLDFLAERTRRPTGDLIADAVARFVEEEAAFWHSLDDAERDVAEGRFHTQEQVEAWLGERIERARERLAEREARS